MAGIVYSNYFIPQNVINVKDIVDSLDIGSCEKKSKMDFYSISGLREINMWCESDKIKHLLDLLYLMFEDTGIDRNCIEKIVFCNYKYSQEGSLSIPHIVKEQCSLINASIMFLDQICASTVYSIDILKEFLVANPRKYALVISLNSMLPDERIRNFTIAGDGMGIMLLGSNNVKFEILDALSSSFGRYSYMQYKMDNREITDLSIAKHATKFISKIIKRNDLSVDNIDCIIPQSTNLMQLKIFSKLLRVPMDKFFVDNMSHGGHIGDVDSIRNLTDYYAQRVCEQEKLLFYSSGLYPSNDICFSEILLERLK